MIAETVVAFKDIKANGVLRAVGERFNVSETRFNEINGTKYGTLVKAVEDVAETSDDAQVEPDITENIADDGNDNSDIHTVKTRQRRRRRG